MMVIAILAGLPPMPECCYSISKEEAFARYYRTLEMPRELERQRWRYAGDLEWLYDRRMKEAKYMHRVYDMLTDVWCDGRPLAVRINAVGELHELLPDGVLPVPKFSP